MWISPSNASETIQGHYCYVYGDSESIKDARAIAKSLAIRNAIESYRVYVSSSTNVKDFKLTEDIVRVLSSGYLKNIKIINSSEGDRKICYGIRATVDPKEFDAALRKEIQKVTKDEKKIESIEPLHELEIVDVASIRKAINWVMNDSTKELTPVDYWGAAYIVKVKALSKIGQYSSSREKIWVKCFDADGALLYKDRESVHGELDVGEIKKIEFHFIAKCNKYEVGIE